MQAFIFLDVYYKIMKYLEIKKFVQKEFKFKNKSLKVQDIYFSGILLDVFYERINLSAI